MKIRIGKENIKYGSEVEITGSKSESNRLLILRELFKEIEIENLSDCEDTQVLQKALKKQKGLVDVGASGTAMRFLTAFFATTPGKKVTLTGTQRMKQRPIEPLVDALRELGAEIKYLEKEGFPPLEIVAGQSKKWQVEVRADISSQFLTALMLVGTKKEKGLKIVATGEFTSYPYLQMTKKLIEQVGGKCHITGGEIVVEKLQIEKKIKIQVEPDWSAASYFYNMVAMAKIGKEMFLKGFRKDSRQGDIGIVQIYKKLGVETYFEKNGIKIVKENNVREQDKKYFMGLDLKDMPDVAQSVVVCCFAMGIDCKIVGLATLRIKETDRLEALKKEIEKFGAEAVAREDSIEVRGKGELRQEVEVEVYQDHRMAMSFASLAAVVPLTIEDCEVVEKSYRGFWREFKGIEKRV